MSTMVKSCEEVMTWFQVNKLSQYINYIYMESINTVKKEMECA